jgi:CubicO group peptidase (beta-lactamase class C family)
VNQRSRHGRIGSIGVPVLALLLGIAGLLGGCSKSPSAPRATVDGLQYVEPEEVGWSAARLDTARQFAEQSGLAAVMAAYDGKVFFSWGEVSRNFRIHSIRKPFTSALYGIHVARREIDLGRTLAQLGIDDIPPSLTDAEKEATVRDLLQSRSGVYHEAAAEESTMIALRPARGSHPHGTYFYYNNWDFNAANTIFMQETGLDLLETLKREIADPIGMQDFSLADCSYRYEYEKSMHPAPDIRMSARDLLRFGVLYQKGGTWLGRRIIPSAWITESTTSYSVYDSASGVGYGYMWNTIPEGTPIAQIVGCSGFYHTGVGVHLLMVLPALKLVIVERVNTDGPWADVGEAGMQLGLMILDARN